MLEHIITVLAGAVMALISTLGYGGIALWMVLESACVPVPSEIVMPFAGFLVFKGELLLWAVALAGAIGNVAGSLIAYAVGAWGGRPFVERYGKYVLLSQRDLDRADHWFERRGEITILIGRLLPVVRTFIALPAGVARMPLWRFCIYTFIGSFIWCWMLAWIGFKLGEKWDTLGVYFHRFDAVVAAAVVVAIGLYMWRHVWQK